MQCYTELVPPSGVSHALACAFLGHNASNLLILKTSLLQVFSLTRIRDGESNKLVLVGEYALSGTVTSVAAVKLIRTRAGGDAVLLAFEDAKMSMIEWDPANHRISTISIHYYEGQNITEQPFGPGIHGSKALLRVDPSSRCAALKFGARHLAILPFWQHGDEIGGDADDGYDVDLVRDHQSIHQSGTHEQSSSARADNRPPYKPSYVLPLTALDSTLLHIVDIVFLHEYREPTFGILSSTVHPSSAMLGERRDCLTFSVFTLDLEQRASTNLVTVTKLPSDLSRVFPLPAPIGGALILGSNALVHVDQSGKVNALAVNEFATQTSDFGMIDASSLGLRLESGEVEVLDATTGDLLIVMRDGAFATLRIQMTGRNIGGLVLQRVDPDDGGLIFESAATTVVSLSGRSMFIGSEDGNSKLISWNRHAATPSKKPSHPVGSTNDDTVDEDMDDIDDDDLYASTTVTRVASTDGKSVHSAVENLGRYAFSVGDVLQSLGPINSICFGQTRTDVTNIEWLASIGRGRESSLASLTKRVIPQSLGSHDIDDATRLWSIHIHSEDSSPNGEEADNLLFVYDGRTTTVRNIALVDRKIEKSKVDLSVGDGAEFEADGETLAVMAIANNSRILQCRRHELRTYDHDLGLAQIIPMMDEETDAELAIVHFSVDGPYILIIRDDSTMQILQIDKSGDAEPMEMDENMSKRKWLSGCLYSGPITGGKPCVFMLGEQASLHIFSLPDLIERFTSVALPHLPPVISQDSQKRRVGAKEALTELLVAELGSEDITRTYLILRTSLDDIVLYETFYNDTIQHGYAIDKLRLRKVPNTYLPRYDETLVDGENIRLPTLERLKVGRRHIVNIRGSLPCFILKERTGLPRVMELHVGRVNALASLNLDSHEQRLLIAGQDGRVRECAIDSKVSYETGWGISRLASDFSGEEIRQIAYHEDRNLYLVATSRNVDFRFPDDEIRYQEPEGVTLWPQIPQFTIHLMLGATKEIIGKLQMPYLDTITTMRVMHLEVSEQTRQRRDVVVVGSAAMHGEDRGAKGAVTVLDLIDVVPEVNRPETGVRLKVMSREETKGVVTAIEQFPGGLIGTVQGQKIMVRGLKEDGSCLPVAFLDALCHMTTLKSLGHSGMWLAGDVVKGLWMGGFVEEPYRISVLGKSRTRLEVMSAEFLPFDEQLFILVVDAETNLHVLQYDPENPASLSGTRLLHRGAFHLGHFPSSMTLLPSTLAPFAQQPVSNGYAEEGQMSIDGDRSPSLFHVLVTTQTGAIGLVTPIDESTYRRLTAIQMQLISTLEHPASLNPRAYRVVEGEGTGARSVVIDGSLIQRISELGTSRRAEILERTGSDVWSLRSDLEIISGAGLGYL